MHHRRGPGVKGFVDVAMTVGVDSFEGEEYPPGLHVPGVVGDGPNLRISRSDAIHIAERFDQLVQAPVGHGSSVARDFQNANAVFRS